uniref:Trehalase n=1 Tax=Oncocephalus sp. TaxID=2944721 RepID=A0AB38ZEW6_9HEMI
MLSNSATQLFTLLLVQITLVTSQRAMPPSCPNHVYCYGKLLHTIQMASIFPDSKTFVDMKMKQNATQTLQIFANLMEKTEQKPTVDELKQFVTENFEPAGSEFERWDPTDWHKQPKFLQKINDRTLRQWANDLHGLWKKLGRKMKPDVANNSHLYSIIPVENPVIVPGGRFREFYYWDSYWIVRGLLLSEMFDTVKGMLTNFVSIVSRYGFIPNGGRVYYLMRSQPPLLIPMVDSYLEFTHDFEFLEKNIKLLEKEFLFWMRNRTVDITKNDKVYKLCRYQDSSSGPRPESYREDVLTAQYVREQDKDGFYSQLKTAAESGWDFSTRWFISDSGNNHGNLTNIQVKSIVPVDLNAIIYWNANLLSKFYKLLNKTKEAESYAKISNEWMEAVNEVLWHPVAGAWLDYDLINNKKRDYFYPSNLAPLWTNCYPKDKRQYYVESTLKYLEKSQVLVNLGGIPSSLEHSGEQWDYPNAWPPLQHIVIMGLANTNNSAAEQLAFELAERWVHSNHKAYEETHAMFEKYDATVVGGHGGGGEYEVQLGFGWSNGVIMDLLYKYGDRIVSKNYLEEMPTVKPTTTNSAVAYTTNHFGPIFTFLLAIGATITASCIGAVVYAKRHSMPRPDKSKYMKIPGCS